MNQSTTPPPDKSQPAKQISGVRRIPVLPVRDTVLFPHAVLPLTVGRESSIQLIESLGDERTIVVTAQIDPRLDSPKPADMHTVGTRADTKTHSRRKLRVLSSSYDGESAQHQPQTQFGWKTHARNESDS
jgi:ATP-dependent Lon protease